MIHPHTELRFINEEVGHGVVATQLIPRGTITWVLDTLDRELSPHEVDAMEPAYQELIDIYAYRNGKGNFILCWDHARFVNHSFRSNCLTTAYDFEIAIRDIQPGEQLTDDYGYLNISSPFRAASEGTKRKVVYPDDTLKYHRTWDKKVSDAFKHIRKHHQPLLHLLSPSQHQAIEGVLEGYHPMESILTTYYYPQNGLGSTH